MSTETDTYGFMASYDDGEVTVSDTMGSGCYIHGNTEKQTAKEIAKYIRRMADEMGRALAEELWEDIESAADEDDEDEAS